MAIGLSHGGTNVYSSKERARQLWVATKDGLVLYERADDGKWRETRRALRGQHISSIIFEPNSGSMFADRSSARSAPARTGEKPGSGAITASRFTMSTASP
ncbi:MAG: hypothetical protein Q8S00_26085 [Deltaproteobacteria bacterium]|nr:hypothetical protein [Deltaproteobacteria bacterium]MDZ4342887.1 hypothetical protein [Candidatus Binatia bacterium]